MNRNFRNPAQELIEMQERISRIYTPPVLEQINSTAKLFASMDMSPILQTTEVTRNLCPPPSLTAALDTYSKITANLEIQNLAGINKSFEMLQQNLTAFRQPLSLLDGMDFSYLHSPAMQNITSLASSLSSAMQPLIDSLAMYNDVAFKEKLFTSSLALDSALTNSFGYLHDIANDFPNEAEQAFSENSLDMPSEELDNFENNDDTISKSEILQEKLATLTFSEKIDYLLRILDIFLRILAFIAVGSNLDVSIDCSKHTERVIIEDTIQETSDTDFNFDLSYGEQGNPENEELIDYIKTLSQQIDTLTEMVSELEKQENSDCCQCDCCDNS